MAILRFDPITFVYGCIYLDDDAVFRLFLPRASYSRRQSN